MWFPDNFGFDIKWTSALFLLAINLNSIEQATRNENNNFSHSGFSKMVREIRPQYYEQQILEKKAFPSEAEDNGNEFEDNDNDFDSKSFIEIVEESVERGLRSRNEPLLVKMDGFVPKLSDCLLSAVGTGEKVPQGSHKKAQKSIFGESELDELGNECSQDPTELRFHQPLIYSGGPKTCTNNCSTVEAEKRMYSLYMFQGQYIAEPRLNQFIDGAIINMITEMRTDAMDPLYFRVLPRGQVISRVRPRQGVKKKPVQRRRRKRRPIRKRKPELQAGRRKIRRRVSKNINTMKNKIESGSFRTGKQQRTQQNAVRGIGSGRIEGLSKIARDGEAEMMLFGNYTLIRSHMILGPVVLTMQFRTRRGLRSTGASLPGLKIHKVTRVSLAGSEMVDFVLERPHPETIQLRGKLFPLAERVAKNIFARLFLPSSFLVVRIREKVGISMLSKPKQATA